MRFQSLLPHSAPETARRKTGVLLSLAALVPLESRVSRASSCACRRSTYLEPALARKTFVRFLCVPPGAAALPQKRDRARLKGLCYMGGTGLEMAGREID